jgi:hypothetical protein
VAAALQPPSSRPPLLPHTFEQPCHVCRQSSDPWLPRCEGAHLAKQPDQAVPRAAPDVDPYLAFGIVHPRQPRPKQYCPGLWGTRGTPTHREAVPALQLTPAEVAPPQGTHSLPGLEHFWGGPAVQHQGGLAAEGASVPKADGSTRAGTCLPAGQGNNGPHECLLDSIPSGCTSLGPAQLHARRSGVFGTRPPTAPTPLNRRLVQDTPRGRIPCAGPIQGSGLAQRGCRCRGACALVDTPLHCTADGTGLPAYGMALRTGALVLRGAIFVCCPRESAVLSHARSRRVYSVPCGQGAVRGGGALAGAQ